MPFAYGLKYDSTLSKNPVPAPVYTFQLTPSLLEPLGHRRPAEHVRALAAGARCVCTSGPPAFPPGSIVADIDISRFGSVGPITEQKYVSQIVNASASA